MHPRIAERIAKVGGIVQGDVVLEVGPGRGILTAALLETGARVVAVEADAALLPTLRERFEHEVAERRLTIVHADIRDYLASGMSELRGPYVVVANIPYYLTGELIRLLLAQERQPQAMTLLLQKEVAERIVAKKKPYSAKATKGKESLLSLSVKAYGTPRYEFTVPKGAFLPAPRVDSAALTIHGISRDHFVSRAEEARFFALLRAGFAHKRKHLAKNLGEAGFAKEAEQVGGVRAEDLALLDWLKLAKSVEE
jgi:16S rRNA (adenine1518-N6/adenine1519-N6)-dimethyltransferase